MGVTLNSVTSIRRQAGAEYLPDAGIHIASGARLQHDGGRLVTYKLPEGLTISVLLHVCAVQKPIQSLGRLPQQGHWSDLSCRYWNTVL